MAGLTAFVGDPAAYYASRGAEKQALQEYHALGSAWQSKTGKPMTPDDWPAIWGPVNAYKAGQAAAGRTNLTMADAFGYVNRLLREAPTPTRVLYGRISEI